MRLRFITTLTVGLAVAGCGAPGAGKATANATPAPAASPSPATSPSPPSPTLGAPLFSDPLDKDNGHEWPVVTNDAYSAAFTGGANNPGYLVSLKQVGNAIELHSTLRGISQAQLRNYAVTVEAHPGVYVGSQDDYGVTCRSLRGKRYGFVANKATSGDQLTFIIFKQDGVTPGRMTLATRTVPALDHEGPMTAVCNTTAGVAELSIYTANSAGGAPTFIVGATDKDAPLTEGYGGVYLAGTATTKPRIVFKDFSIRPVL